MKFFLGIFSFFVVFTFGYSNEDQIKKDWWEVSAFYQIYPRSFKDSDGDGIGDLKGITQKLPYLKELGINGTWLSPIFKSPMADFGYDISDFFDIQSEYGTMEDFEAMTKRAKELDIKIILDFVPNHSSDENEWFIKSANKEPGFEDFYVWHPGYVNPNNSSNRLPPNNWLCAFRKSAWQWNEQRKEFYLHQFAIQQPDLNYRNPKVVETMKSVLRFWLDRGVSGFRIDAVPHIFEIKPDAQGNYKDEPVSGLTNDPEEHAYLKHIYTMDQDETVEMVYQWREVLDQYKKDHGGETRIMMTEAYSEIDVIVKYYGDGKRDGSHIPFNFQMIKSINANSNARDFQRIIDLWLDNLPKGRTANWVIGNHDNRRVASRLGENRIDGISMIIQSLPGASITYNGEEIGMTDVLISWEDTVDPAACNSNPSIYEQFTRDPARTPFQWDSTNNAGFTAGNKTWLPVSPKYREVNVDAQKKAAKSHLKIYEELIHLRQTPTFQYGSVKVKSLNDNVLSILRKLKHHKSYIAIINLGGQRETIDLTALGNLPLYAQYKIVENNSKNRVGNRLITVNMILEPYESTIIEF